MSINEEKSSMSRRDFFNMTAGSAAALAATQMVSGCTPQTTPKSKPNILLVMTDQQHIDTIAAGGNRHIRTPALDRLYTGGVSFTESYCNNPVCGPARGAIFTGRMPSECGVIRNGDSIRSDIPHLGQWFTEQTDYENIYAGKWHLPEVSTFHIDGFKVLNDGDGKQGDIGDKPVSRSCEAYLRYRPRSKPFFMVASFVQPHDICFWLRFNEQNHDQLRYPHLKDDLPELPANFKYDPKEPQRIRNIRAGIEPAEGNWTEQHWRYYLWSYYRHVEMVDAAIGNILDTLDQTGYMDNTIVLFTADHGEGCAHHQMVRKNTPYDEACKVPLIVYAPDKMNQSVSDSEHLVSSLDIMPTLCDYAGIQTPPGLQGKSLRPLLEGKSTEWHSAVHVELLNDSGRVLRTDRYKYIVFKDDPTEMLFDMENDPGETINLATSTSHASILEEQRKLLNEWESSLDKKAASA